MIRNLLLVIVIGVALLAMILSTLIRWTSKLVVVLSLLAFEMVTAAVQGKGSGATRGSRAERIENATVLA